MKKVSHNPTCMKHDSFVIFIWDLSQGTIKCQQLNNGIRTIEALTTIKMPCFYGGSRLTPYIALPIALLKNEETGL